MTTPKAGGCYKRLPGGAIAPVDNAAPVDQAPVATPPAPAPVAKARRRANNSTQPASTVPAASGNDTVSATTATDTQTEPRGD